ncbi:M56 family metallopeptidase [Amycolatopsis saalfeldensis]|uniref:Peptidase family M48 n=1 Tax=Amycolatopsis saalfeldensis TaxID=394193 RepID=A0A1H8YMX3_9PSEU|nr:M56 family metallopeptidase [Amycolatopsis saalfeldensis]SEP53554.1 Peptidase family M48 [Amycolatopsis saalfeldensis]
MIVAAALLLGALIVGWWSPRPLSRLAAGRISPATATAWWLLTAVGVLAGAVAGVLLLVLPGHGPADAVLRVLHDCWAALSHSGLPLLDPVVGASAGALALAGAVRLAVASAGRRRHRNLQYRRHLAALRLCGVADAQTVPTLWLPHDEPVAYSLGGRRAMIVASEGLAARLSGQELDAVLAHERAHLRDHHHLLTACADVLGRTARFVPLMRELPAAIRLLVELSADHVAAAQCGTGPLRSALLSIRTEGGPRRALAMAGGDTAIRLDRLQARPPRAHPMAGRVTAVAGGLTAFLAPSLVAGALVAFTGLVSCS